MSDAIPPALIAVTRPGPCGGEAKSLAAPPTVGSRTALGRLARLMVGPVDVTLYEIQPDVMVMGCKTPRRRLSPSAQHLGAAWLREASVAKCDAGLAHAAPGTRLLAPRRRSNRLPGTMVLVTSRARRPALLT